MDDIGWGLDPWGMEAWGSLFEESPEIEEIEIEKVDGVVESPGIFVFEIDD
jgi:hypothetical protein